MEKEEDEEDNDEGVGREKNLFISTLLNEEKLIRFIYFEAHLLRKSVEI